jgi:hypothetical protein
MTVLAVLTAFGKLSLSANHYLLLFSTKGVCPKPAKPAKPETTQQSHKTLIAHDTTLILFDAASNSSSNFKLPKEKHMQLCVPKNQSEG